MGSRCNGLTCHRIFAKVRLPGVYPAILVAGRIQTMAIREIIMLGNPLLRQKARKVARFDPALRKLVADLFDTLASVEGVGLAAPQIAQLVRVFVVEYTEKETGRHYRFAVVNPEIVEAGGVQRGVD